MKTLTKLILLTLFMFTLSNCNKVEPDVETNITPNDFLSGDNFERLKIDVVYVDGYEPNAAALDELHSFLTQILHKPKGITFHKTKIDPPANHTYTVDDIRKIEEEERTIGTNVDKKELSAFIFYANKDYAENSGNGKTLGVQYGPTSMALFKSTINEFSGGLTQPTTYKLETTVLEHEFGHALGLVNVGTSTVQDHEDAGHPGHCDNENCLMYYKVESSDFASLLFGEEIPTLDGQCLQDLKANGGK